MAVIPNSFKYGIFSTTPAKVPFALTFDEECFVKPRT